MSLRDVTAALNSPTTTSRNSNANFNHRMFISTTNCFVHGGVESILRQHSQTNLGSQPSNNIIEAGTLPEPNNDFSPITPPSSLTPTNASKKFGANFLQSVKSSTAAMESQLRGMAIRACNAENKNPDMTAAMVFRSVGSGWEEIGCTEFKSVGMEERVQYVLPIGMEELDASGMMQIRIVIRSGAQVLGMKQSRQYVIALANFPFSNLPQKGYSTLSSNVTSKFVRDGVITLTLFPNVSIPKAMRMGWSLSDPVFPNGDVFDPNLCQVYHHGEVVAIERSIESTLVLPVATAFTKIFLESCKISALHAKFLAQKVSAYDMIYKDGMQAMKAGNIDAGIQIYHFWKFSEGTLTSEFLKNVPVRIHFQSPIDIFERELGHGEVPMYSVATNGPCDGLIPNQLSVPNISIPFYPLMAKPSGNMQIGRLRVEVLVQENYGLSNSFPSLDMEVGNFMPPNPNNTNPVNEDVPEGFVEIDAILNVDGGHIVNVPIFYKEKQLGVLSVLVSARTMDGLVDHTNVQPAHHYNDKYIHADGGLVDMVKIHSLIDRTSPLDRTLTGLQDAEAQTKGEDASVRHRQLSTMGYFLSPQFMNKHAKYRVDCVTELQKRFDQYRGAINHIPPGESETEIDKRKFPSPFRPSSSKGEPLLSGIPFNVHVQSLTIGKLPSREEVAVFSNVTCGAPADHARGFAGSGSALINSSSHGNTPYRPAGGLKKWQDIRTDLAKKLHVAKSELINAVKLYFQANKGTQRGHYIPASNNHMQQLRATVYNLEQKLGEFTWECAMRRGNVFSQALGIALTSYISSVSSIRDSGHSQHSASLVETWTKHGFLLCFEGMLSAAGKEMGMIEDAAIAVEMLNMVGVLLVPDEAKDLLGFDNQGSSPSDNTTTCRVPIYGSQFLKWVEINKPLSRGSILVKVGVTDAYFSRIPLPLKSAMVQFYPVLFQMGVDIRQWGANAGSTFRTTIQQKSKVVERRLSRVDSSLDEESEEQTKQHMPSAENCDLLMKLNQQAFRLMNFYAHRAMPLSSDAVFTAAENGNAVGPSASVHPLLTTLSGYIRESAGKMQHGVLDAAAVAASKLGGGGIVYCKSGKDRTAMQVTYKQAQFLHKFICASEDMMVKKSLIFNDATLMRSYGTRLTICEKNVGQPKYAFNALQSKFMPEMLKPPPAATAGFLKGGKVFSREGMIES